MIDRASSKEKKKKRKEKEKKKRKNGRIQALIFPIF